MSLENLYLLADEGVDIQETLPPPEAWLINPYKDKFETPVDDRGFVDVDTLVQAVKDTVHSEYEWPRKRSIHHLYWHEDWYRHPELGGDGRLFRELPVNKVLIPRVFHSWLHLVTIPPDVPDPYLMRRRIESWAVAKDLFESSRLLVQWNRRAERRMSFVRDNPDILPKRFNGADIIGSTVLAGMIGRHEGGMEMHLERLLGIPEEDRFVVADAPPEEIANELGKIVVPGVLKRTAAVAA